MIECICNKLNESCASRKCTKVCWDSINQLKSFTKQKSSAERKITKEDGSKAKTSEENADVFRVHFEKLYNRKPEFDPTIIESLEQRTVAHEISIPPNTDEIKSAIGRLKNNSPGKSGLTARDVQITCK